MTNTNLIINGGFEEGENGCNGLFHQDLIPGWNTTATDGIMEVWCDGRVLAALTYNAKEGNRFAQVNANQTAGIYQEFETNPGDVLTWSFSHMARGAGEETVWVKMGPSIDSLEILDTRTATQLVWQDYTGTYTVPSGQTSSVFMIESTSGGEAGNLVDAVSVEITEPAGFDDDAWSVVDFSSISLAPGDIPQVITTSIDGGDLPTSATVNAPTSTPGSDDLVLLSGRSEGRLLRIEDSNPAIQSEWVEASITLESNHILGIEAEGGTNLNSADYVTLTPIDPSENFFWVVGDHSNCTIEQDSSSVLTITSESSASDFAEFTIRGSAPVGGVIIRNENATTESINSVQLSVLILDSSEPLAPAFSVSPSTITLTEGHDSAPVAVTLSSAPPVGEIVAINIASQDTDQVVVDPQAIIFDHNNWDITLNPIITSVNNSVVDGNTTTEIIFSVNESSTSAYLDVPPQSVLVTVQDDEIPGFLVDNIQVGDIAEGSESVATFDVVLGAAPIDPVIIDISSLDTTEATISNLNNTLAFTSSNWNIPQTVEINSVEDIIVDGTVTATIVVGINALSDARWTSLANQSIFIDVTDNDVPGFTTSHTGLLIEGDPASVIVDVVLDAQPLTNVIIDASVDDVSEVSLDKSQIVFTPASWNVHQRITVTSIDDFLIDGTSIPTLTLSVNDSSDSAFTSVADQQILIPVLDNEVASIVINEGPSDVGIVWVSISTQPDPGDFVIIGFQEDDPSTAEAHRITVFNNANWNVPQRMEVKESTSVLEVSEFSPISSYTGLTREVEYSGLPLAITCETDLLADIFKAYDKAQDDYSEGTLDVVATNSNLKSLYNQL